MSPAAFWLSNSRSLSLTKDDPESLFKKGMRFRNGEDGTPRDDDKTRAYLLAAAKLDHAEAQFELCIFLGEYEEWPVRRIQKVIPIAECLFRILVNRDGLYVLVAIAFASRPSSHFCKGFYPRRVIRIVIVVFRPPSTRLAVGSSVLSLSRSEQRPSMLTSIRVSRSSADAVEIPAR